MTAGIALYTKSLILYNRITYIGKGCERMSDETMTKEEMITYEINTFTNLLRIKKYATEENPELEYQIKISRAKLEAYGIVTENLLF